MFELIISEDKELHNNHKKISEIILGLSQDIESCKSDITAIQNRNWFQRLFNNNTRDLASAMLKQQDTLSAFFQIIQCLLVLYGHNYRLLLELRNDLKDGGKKHGLYGNTYIKMATRQLDATINSKKKDKKSFDVIYNRHRRTEDKLKNHSKLLFVLSLGELIIIGYLLFNIFLGQ
jgi:hypothetical protein